MDITQEETISIKPLLTIMDDVFSVLRVFLVLSGGMLVAIQLRLMIPFGMRLGPEYIAQPLRLYLWLLIMSIAGVTLTRILRLHPPQYMAALLAVLLSCLAILLDLPLISGLQVVYFLLVSWALAVMVFRWTPVLQDKELRALLHSLFHHRDLLWLWTAYTIRSRYSQTILGILWIILVPFSTALILALVFSQVMRSGDIGDVPFVAFFLSGLTFWMLSQNGMVNATKSVLGQMGLINQLYFPREILVLVQLGITMVDFAFMFVVLMVINRFLGLLPSVHYMILPLLLLIQVVWTLGAMLFISYLSVLIRDVPRLVDVVMQLLFYLVPIIYPLSILPQPLRWILSLNPITLIIESYRDVMLYHRFPEWHTLYIPIVSGVVLLYSGYLNFKRYDLSLSDYT